MMKPMREHDDFSAADEQRSMEAVLGNDVGQWLATAGLLGQGGLQYFVVQGIGLGNHNFIAAALVQLLGQ